MTPPSFRCLPACLRTFFSWTRIAVLLLTVGALATVARAQSVHWENSDSGDPSDVQLVFQDCAPDGDPATPHIDGTTLSLTGTSSQTTMTNFNVSRSTILTYHARSQRGGALRIPSFTVKTNKGALRVPSFTGGATRTAADVNVSSRLELGAQSVWAGEVFPLTYALDISRRSFNQLGSNLEWNPSPLVIEDWSKFESNETFANGESRLSITSKTRAYAKTAGSVSLNAISQLVNIQSGSIGFGLFQTPRIEQLSVSSDRPSLLVRALPSPAPAGFTGAVGQFKLTSKVIPTNAAVGEPITWTVELSGTGNWPDIAGLPQRDVSKDFSVVQPQAKRTPAEGKLFDATLSEDVVLVPTKAGNYTLGPLAFVYFDPATGTYQTISTPRTTVAISAAAAPGASATTPAPAAAAAQESPAHPVAPPKPPAEPEAIPRSPLSGSSEAIVPLPDSTVLMLVLAPFALLPFVWAWLAIGRARRTDPIRPRREARARMATTIGRLRGEKNPALILEWQRDAALLWNLSHAAPGPAVFETAPPADDARKPASSDVLSAWRQLWLDADRALYSEGGVLPADWPDRAAAALKAKSISGFRPWTALLPRNLFPFVALLAVACLIPAALRAQGDEPKPEPAHSTPVHGASAAAAAYQHGDFPAAESAWMEILAKSPADAVARHNLSLALAQQDRWGESAAHAAAAFIQDPSNAAQRAQLALACEKAGYVPSVLAGFLPPGPVQSLADHASPGSWQWLLIAAAWIFSVALAALLYGAYCQRGRWWPRAAFSILAVSGFAGICAAASLHSYGPAADRRATVAWRAGILRSIPTEADTTQKTTTLPAGSVAIEDQTFLGWVRLVFPNGQTGWVRKEDVIPLWR